MAIMSPGTLTLKALDIVHGCTVLAALMLALWYTAGGDRDMIIVTFLLLATANLAVGSS